jgi:SAM-dependent methyltransferase
VALFQEKQGDLAQRRDKIEYAEVMTLLEQLIRPWWHVLDAGCGTGRWAFRVAPLVNGVEAFDISPALIDVCKQEAERLGVENVDFYVERLETFPYRRPPYIDPFDLVVISGVCLYTNDRSWGSIIANLRARAKVGAYIVVREAVGSAGRHELEEVYSQELECRYSAVYRDPDWFRAAFGTFCRVLHDASLFPPELEKWPETHQRLFLFEVDR